MALRSRFMHPLLVVACACAALAAGTFANSQSPAPATPQGQEAQPAPQTPADTGAGFGTPDIRRTEYRGFLQLVSTGEPSLKVTSTTGEVDNSGQVTSWTKVLGIQENEVRVMLIIAEDAWGRLKRIEDRGHEQGKEYLRNPTRETREKFDADNKEIVRENREILDETIARLRQQLGQEDFKKLDDYIYSTSVGGMLEADAKRRANARSPQQSGSGPGPAPAREPQQ